MERTRTAESRQQSAIYQPIEDYTVIGDLHTVALVGKNGSIDWLCLPRFDSPTVFGALLDAGQGGYFLIAPHETPGIHHKQLYLPETNIMITRFLTVDGVGEITDFMLVKSSGSDVCEHHLVHSVKVVRGSLSFELVCRPTFNNARDKHTLHLQKKVVFQSASLDPGLASSISLVPDCMGGVRATFTLHAGQSALFLLESAEASERVPQCPPLCDYEESFAHTPLLARLARSAPVPGTLA